MYPALCSLFLCGAPLCAQVVFGNLEGTVFDQRGVQLGHAAITARNTVTGVESSGETSGQGGYRISDIRPGNYSVRISAFGFAAVQFNDVEIQPAKTVRLEATLPRAESTAVSLVKVTEAVQISASPEDVKISQREVASLRDRLALSANQQLTISAIFEQRQAEIAEIRDDGSLWPSERRERIQSIRREFEAKFRAVLNENQLDEYEEILRERRERSKSLAVPAAR
jgi:hypothetical protein